MTDITVVIPTRNRAKMLGELLDSLRNQKAEGLSWEVLVMDNGSSDDTSRVVQSKKTDFPVPLRYIYEPNPGLHNVRNRGAIEADGEVVAYLDDDMVLDERWIQGSRPVLEGRADLVGGKILPLWEAEPPRWTRLFYSRSPGGRTMAYLGLLDYGEKVKAIDAIHVFGGNSFVRKEAVIGLKGYHPDSFPPELIRFRGDGEGGFTAKFMQAHLVSLYSPVALAYHRIDGNRLTAEYLCRRSYNEGISRSFTTIREEHGLYGEAGKEQSGRVLRVVTTALSFAAGQLHSAITSPGSVAQSIRVRLQLKKAYRRGFAFHQGEVKKDPVLRIWVLRPDYMGENGRLPGEVTGEAAQTK